MGRGLVWSSRSSCLEPSLARGYVYHILHLNAFFYCIRLSYLFSIIEHGIYLKHVSSLGSRQVYYVDENNGTRVIKSALIWPYCCCIHLPDGSINSCQTHFEYTRVESVVYILYKQYLKKSRVLYRSYTGACLPLFYRYGCV